MAEPITSIQRRTLSEEEQKKQDLKEIEEVLLANKEGILSSIEILNGLQSNGVLTIINGLLKEGEEVMDILVKTIDQPGVTKSIKNLLLMGGLAGSIDVDKIKPMLDRLNNGLERVSEEEENPHKTNIFSLLKLLRDPEVNRTVTLMVSFLQGMGQAPAQSEAMPNEKKAPDTDV
ncbi:uncharacterized protein YjgD (DUF1641 family) [Sinobaca qinghaiensis]|uniref:Uncharacterized protein YjgD (DUF1641 family) n=1 Tax=Sinobaca qinghaiensis TaxID=342944 RepID=A0A419UW43_9BACL|nr:DUF1641 domain-containing protein [Sinobaca qinghaiensis]RKD68793.1 uncharacterized protein YjgD (DUF1641 family) [Sinobaca qinghaiensis]